MNQWQEPYSNLELKPERELDLTVCSQADGALNGLTQEAECRTRRGLRVRLTSLDSEGRIQNETGPVTVLKLGKPKAVLPAGSLRLKFIVGPDDLAEDGYE